MARSKLGGTKAKLRGVVGDVIYQIARNPYAGYEQKVIAYTKEKLNRNTRQQCLARMQIAFYQRMMAVLAPILSESFQFSKKGLPSINRFVEVNMKGLQDYCRDHWKEAQGFYFPAKGHADMSWGICYISEGSFAVPDLFSIRGSWEDDGHTVYCWRIPHSGKRLYDLRKALSFSYDDAINIVSYVGEYDSFAAGCFLSTLKFNRQFGDYTVITQSNCSKVFSHSFKYFGLNPTRPYGNQLKWTWDDSTSTLSVLVIPQFRSAGTWFDYCTFLQGVIWLHKRGNVWQRSTTLLRPSFELDETIEWGRPVNDSYASWDENYNDEDYIDYF